MLLLKFIIFIIILALIVGYLWINISDNIFKHIIKSPFNGSIYLRKNNVVLLDKNSNTLFPLASTVKIIVAIEFVKQISSKRIDINEKVHLNQLEKYHIKLTDGGAHKAWLHKMKQQSKIQENKINILEIARGMIEFSSNANTEYLMDKLGFENLNNLLKELDLKQHEKLYPFVSSLFVIHDNLFKDSTNITKKEYIDLSFKVHEKLKNNERDISFAKEKLTKENIKIFSDFFIQGTTKEYVSILDKLNKREYFSDKEYEYIDYIMTPPYPNKECLHSGMKGGSTRFILNMAFYETYKDGDRIEGAIFLNNLNIFQYYYYSFGLFKTIIDILNKTKLDLFQKLLNSKS